jgi:hypothetical protein
MASSMSSSDSRSLPQIAFSTHVLALLHRKLGVAPLAPEDSDAPIIAMSTIAWQRGKDRNRMGRSLE